MRLQQPVSNVLFSVEMLEKGGSPYFLKVPPTHFPFQITQKQATPLWGVFKGQKEFPPYISFEMNGFF